MLRRAAGGVYGVSCRLPGLQEAVSNGPPADLRLDARDAFNHVIEGFAERLAKGMDDPFTRYYVACGYAVMGDKKHALQHLEKAIEGRRNFNVARARVEFDFDTLRGDADFQALIGSSQVVNS